MTHQQRVHELAEKMAKQDTGELYALDVIPHYIPLAELAVKEMAEVGNGLMLKFNDCTCEVCNNEKKYFLKSNGLIP